MKPILRVPVVVVLTLGAISIGIAGVHAADCVRFIRKTVKHHHRVSAETAARWIAWDKAHPHWHPKPTPTETLAKLDFACQVPIEEKHSADLLPPLELPAMAFPLEMAAPPETPMVIASNPVPPPTFPEETGNGLVEPPIYTPQYPTIFTLYSPPTKSQSPPPPPPPSATPEPGSVMLLGTGLAALAALAMRKRLQESRAIA